MLVDFPLEELWNYKPARNSEEDFNEFWNETLEISKNEALNVELKEISHYIKDINTNKLYYDGFGGARIGGFYLTPKKKGSVPAIIWFPGYGDNKNEVSFYLSWVLLGYAVVAIDIRGQLGESIDNKAYPGPSAIGYMTKGVVDKQDYYFRGVYMDCVKLLDFLETRKEIDMSRICVAGASQGGGLALAVSALDERPKFTLAEIPFLCHYRRAIEWAEEFKPITYIEFTAFIKRFPELADKMYSTLSYFDNMNLCDRIKNKTIMSVAMKDMVCPPSTNFAVYNNIKSDKDIDILEYWDHSWETVLKYEEKRLEHFINNI
jgi:cephalosporin-C deacetylase